MTENEKLIQELQWELKKHNQNLRRLEIAEGVMFIRNFSASKKLKNEVQDHLDYKRQLEENIEALQNNKPMIHKRKKDYIKGMR